MSLKAHSPPMRLLRWLNAGFLILAACRALVPGLCATQAAALDAAERKVALHPCCQARAAATTLANADAPSIGVPIPEHAACGFCALVHGMLETLDTCRVAPPVALVSEALLLPVQAPSRAIAQTHRGRAPPILG